MATIAVLQVAYRGEDNGFQTVNRRVNESFDKTVANAEKASDAVESYGDALKGLIGNLSAAGAEMLTFDAMAKTVTKTVNNLSKAFESSAPGAYSGELGRVSAVMGALSAELATLRGEISGLNRAFASKSPDKFAANISTSTASAIGLGTAASAAQAQVTALNGALAQTKALSMRGQSSLPGQSGSKASGLSSGSISGLGALGGAVSKYIGAPLLAGAGISAFLSSQFETSLAKLEAFAGASHTEIQALKPEFMKLAETVGIMPNKLADGYYSIRSLGIKGRESLDVLRISAQASTAGLGEMKDVTGAITSLMYAFGLSAKEAGDEVARAAVLSKSDPSQFFRNLGQAIPITAALKLNIRDILAMTAIFTREGLSPAKGFQRVTAMVDSMSKPSSQQRNVAKMLGIDFGQFRKELQTNFAGAIEEVATKSHNKLDLIRTFFGARRAGDAALALLNPTAKKENEQVFKDERSSGGSVEAAQKVAADTVAMHWKRAFASAYNAAVQFGDTTQPMVKHFADAVKGAFDFLQGLSTGSKRTIAEFALIGGAIAMVGGKLLSLAPAIRAALGIFAAMDPEVIGAVLGIAAVVALVAVAINRNWGGIRDTFQSMLSSVSASWSETWPNLVYIFKETWAVVGPAVKWFVVSSIQLFADFVKITAAQIRWIVGIWSNAVAGMKVMFGNGMAGVKDYALNMAGSVVSAVGGMVKGVLHEINGMVSSLNGVTSLVGLPAIPGLGGAEAAAGAYQSVGDTMQSQSQQDLQNRITQAASEQAKAIAQQQAMKGTNDPKSPLDFLSSLRGLTGIHGPIGGGGGLDTSDSGLGGGRGRKGRQPKESQDDREKGQRLQSLKEKLASLAQTVRLYGNESDAAAAKDETLFGEFASKTQQVNGLVAALNKLKGLKGFSMEEGAKALFGESYANLQPDSQIQVQIYELTRLQDKRKADADSAKDHADKLKSALEDVSKAQAEYKGSLVDPLDRNDLLSLSKYGVMFKDLDKTIQKTVADEAQLKFLTEVRSNLKDYTAPEFDYGDEDKNAHIKEKNDLAKNFDMDEFRSKLDFGDDAAQSRKDAFLRTFSTSMRSLTREMISYSRATKEAKIEAIEFDEAGQRMSRAQAAAVVTMQDYVARLKSYREEMSNLASKASGALTSILGDFFENGTRDIGKRILAVFRQTIQSMVLEAAGSKLKSWFERAIGGGNAKPKEKPIGGIPLPGGGGFFPMIASALGRSQNQPLTANTTALEKLTNAIEDMLSQSGGGSGSSSSGGMASSALSAIKSQSGSGVLGQILRGLPRFAVGGDISYNHPSWVGDGGNGSGAELFMPRHSGTIVPGSKVSMGDTHNYNFHMHVPAGFNGDRATLEQSGRAIFGRMAQAHAKGL